MLDKKINFIISFIFILISSSYSQMIYKNIELHPPLKIPMLLSGNFAELRLDHFHSGIDIKTGGRIGKEVFSIESGYVSRIKITPNGYGKTLYITHPNGITSVYAHLDRFNDTINQYAKSIQYNKKSFLIDLSLNKNELVIEKGEIIAFSGNTGGSSGPHLHFEIRETKTQNPLNPLNFKFNIRDNIKPVIYNLILYPKNSEAIINNTNDKTFFKVIGTNGNYVLNNASKINVWGKIGFGIEAYDYLNNSRNRCGIYEIQLYMDSIKVYNSILRELSFSTTRYINSYMDYEEKIKNKKNIHKTFIDPNNNLKVYKDVIHQGIFNFKDSLEHHIQFILKDVYDNTSTLSVSLTSSKPDSAELKIKNTNYTEIFPYNFENSFSRDDIKIIFPKNTFYDSLFFEYAMTAKENNTVAPIHYIHNLYTPVHKKFQLYLKTINLPEELRNKAEIAWINEKNEFIGVGGEWNNGFVYSTTRNLGKYTVVLDTIAPKIEPLNFMPETKNFTNKTQISFKITDDISGIKSYNGFINNNWVLFEYDKKNDLLFYNFDNDRLKKSNEYELELYVTDEKNNISIFNTIFFR